MAIGSVSHILALIALPFIVLLKINFPYKIIPLGHLNVQKNAAQD